MKNTRAAVSRGLAAAGTPLRTPKTAELVAMRLRRDIVRGELLTGDVLPTEAELMTQFGISRPTLREAIRILEAESLLSSRRGTRGGAQVTGPDIAVAARYIGMILQMQGTTLADIQEARMLIEPICAGLLAERHTAKDLRDLRACVEVLHRIADHDATAPAPGAEYIEFVAQFHRLVVERAGNRSLAVQATVLGTVIAAHRAHTAADGAGPHRYGADLGSLDELVGLIAAGDRRGAQEHWAEHLRVTGGGLLRGRPGGATVVDLFA
ncbi:FadR/GntR family transcriptional regulator [Nocardia harenae]|uniref:FadR/GntR family transcriptional regulator n=1 Tax=Nocardia harenae TaxID=358707 RepID=UPI00082E6550|nr:GntR family transcriptional regulator [Nocardia harenae]